MAQQCVNSATCGIVNNLFFKSMAYTYCAIYKLIWTCNIPPIRLSLIICNSLSLIWVHRPINPIIPARDKGGCTTTHLEGVKFRTMKDSANSYVKKATMTQRVLFFLHRKKREDWMNWTNVIIHICSLSPHTMWDVCISCSKEESLLDLSLGQMSFRLVS